MSEIQNLQFQPKNFENTIEIIEIITPIIYFKINSDYYS